MMEIIAQHAGLIGLLFFFIVFVTIAFWALKPANKQRIESYKYIPLEEKKDD